MDFTPKEHLEVGNYIQYIDEILHKCDKGIEYCKLCPNESVCSTLEQDEFGLEGIAISDALTAIQHALHKIPGYLHHAKRNELKEQIKRYINESPAHERNLWEKNILKKLLDEKLSRQLYRPAETRDKIRTLLTYNEKVSFSTYLTCLSEESEEILPGTPLLPLRDSVSDIIMIVNKSIGHSDTVSSRPAPAKFYFEMNVFPFTKDCKLADIRLSAALCYYATQQSLAIPENFIVTGGLDNQGNVLPVESLGAKIETVLRELHFVNTILIPANNPHRIQTSESVRIIEVENLEQAIDTVLKKTIL
ncbi:MAG: hypothetical protein MRJ65_16605 [Candidatus Brocadiaceae bacterium]|nr:hypothetical protein [Candidatus Brocadiaceae bacterium]